MVSVSMQNRGCRLSSSRKVAEPLGRIDGVVGRLPSRFLFEQGQLPAVARQLVAEPVEAALGAEQLQGLDVGRLSLERIPVERQRQVVAQTARAGEPAGRSRRARAGFAVSSVPSPG